jgi:hypothetical protein
VHPLYVLHWCHSGLNQIAISQDFFCLLFRHRAASLADHRRAVSCYPRAVTLRILAEAAHPRTQVDPFGQLPCKHKNVLVHTTNGDQLGDDLLECPRCEYVVSLSDLYAAIRMPPGLGPTS